MKDMLSTRSTQHLCLLVGMSIMVEGFSQVESVRTHSIRTGVSSHRITDDYFGAYQKNIKSFDLEYGYAIISPGRHRQITVHWNGGLTRGVGYNEFAIAYADAFSIIQNKQRGFNMYAGYSLSTNPVYIRENIETGIKYSWATTTSLSFTNINSYTWKANRILMMFSLPLAGFAARPLRDEAYNENVNAVLYNSYKNVFFTSWHNVRAVNLSMEFSTKINSNWGALLGYKHNFKLLKEGIDFSEQSNGLQIGISYRLK